MLGVHIVEFTKLHRKRLRRLKFLSDFEDSVDVSDSRILISLLLQKVFQSDELHFGWLVAFVQCFVVYHELLFYNFVEVFVEFLSSVSHFLPSL